jgi:hypothetical protein
MVGVSLRVLRLLPPVKLVEEAGVLEEAGVPGK